MHCESKRRIIQVLIWTTLFLLTGCAAEKIIITDDVTDELLKKVMVKRMDLDLSRKQTFDGELLWNTFANRPYETQFSILNVKNWYWKSRQFQSRILLEAKKNGFDCKSLQKVLKQLKIKKNDETARIPVGAFAARNGSREVWIIVVKWEFAAPYNAYRSQHWLSMEYIEVAAFDMKNGKKVASVRSR